MSKTNRKIIIRPAKYGEAKKGDYVELLIGYMLIREGSVGQIVGFTREGRVRVEFPMVLVGWVNGRKPLRGDRFIEADLSSLKLIEKHD